MGKKLAIRIIAGVFISIVIIYYSIRSIGSLNPALLFDANINWWLVCTSAAVFACSVFIRAMVYPFGINKKIGIMEAFQIVAVSNAANMLLPLHAGELFRFSMFPHDFSAAKRTWLILIPAAADLLAVFTISELALPVSGFHNPAVVKILHVVSVIILAAIFILLVLLYCVPRLTFTSRHFSKNAVSKMIIWVFLSWIIMLMSIILGMMAYGYDFHQSVQMSFSIFASTNIVMLLPSSPGGIGLFEYGVVLGMEGFGIMTFPAKEIGMLLHLIQYVTLLPLGLWLLLRRNIRHNGNMQALSNTNLS